MLHGCGTKRILGLIYLLYWLVFQLDVYLCRFLLVEHLNRFIKVRIFNESIKEIKDFNGIEIDEAGRTVKVDGKPIDLSLREFELLKYLLDNEKIALSRDKILNAVWNYDYDGDLRTVDTHVKQLRGKLGEAASKYISTVRSVGYKLELKFENDKGNVD